MTAPSLLFALAIALLLGSLYHLIRGGSFWRLLFYFVMSIVGFVIGHFVGLWRGWLFFPLGSLNIGLSSIGSLLFLVLGDWLSRIEVNSESTV